MELTEKDIDIVEDNCVIIKLPNGSLDNPSEVKNHILDIQKKAEKYNQITLNGTIPVTVNWIREQINLFLKLEQEMKQLKEILKENN